MQVVMIRHGATSGNLEKRYIGRTDESLTAQAVRECEKKREGFRKLFMDEKSRWLYVTSPMKRCIETLELLSGETTERLKAKVIPDFSECDFGLFEGKNYLELKDCKAYQAWIDSGGTMDFPEGEPLDEFKERNNKAFLQLISAAEGRYDGICMVVHGGTIMAIAERFGNAGKSYFAYQVKNLEQKTFVWDGSALCES